MDRQFGIECARFGWKAFHEKDSRKSRKGWPDWVASNGVYTIFAEFKTAKDPLKKDQYEWLVNLLATGHRAYVIRPANFGVLIEMLIFGASYQVQKLSYFNYKDAEYKLTVATQHELANCKWRGK